MCPIFATSVSVANFSDRKSSKYMFYDTLCISWTSSKQSLLDSELNKMEHILIIV